MDASAGKRLRFVKTQVSAGTPTTSSEETELVAPVWAPKAWTVFKLLLAARLMSAIFSGISDCDETYNYWEPTHYLVYGNGFQTWEYSPTYAIRSYAYIILHAIPVKLHHIIFPGNKIGAFYGLRCLLGLVSAICETYMYRGVLSHYGAHVARLTAALLFFSAGMYVSATAYLPSSFSMYLNMVALGAWYKNNLKVAIWAVAISAFLGWPFAAVLGVPIAYEVVVRRKRLMFFMMHCLGVTVVILGPVVVIDSYYFGKLVVAPVNIILYNVLSDHGPDLYGTEPWTYYLFNGFLNFNGAFFLALASIFLLYLVKLKTTLTFPGLPHWLSLAPFYLWMAIFVSQPHKEERFLFPVYPHICLCAALALDAMQRLVGWACSSSGGARRHQHYLQSCFALPVLVLGVYAALCVSRIMALHTGYRAPVDVYTHLYEAGTTGKLGAIVPPRTVARDSRVNVCVGKEWYRFPSNFFIPPDRWQVKFLQSEFKGQLPSEYSSDANATRLVPEHMNDLNLEETSRYVNLSLCHYIVDLDRPTASAREPRYSVNDKEWEVVYSAPFLDAQRSHPIYRSFFMPYFTSKYCSYNSMNILKSKRRSNSAKGRV